jgi:hypothetical protein
MLLSDPHGPIRLAPRTAGWNFSAFVIGARSSGCIYSPKIIHPVNKSKFDVFRVLEELTGPKFEIQFD